MSKDKIRRLSGRKTRRGKKEGSNVRDEGEQGGGVAAGKNTKEEVFDKDS